MRVPASVLAAVLAFAGSEAVAIETPTGPVRYLDRIGMPPGETFGMRPGDASSMDDPVRGLGAVLASETGNPGQDVATPHSPDVVWNARRYTGRARLRMGERLPFAADARAPALTDGAGDHAAITLVQVRTPAEAPRRMIGEFLHFGEAASFAECGTSETYPVAMEGAYLEAKRGYLHAEAEPMAPVVAVLEGEIAKRQGTEGGKRDTLIIDRLAGFVPGLTCERAMADSNVENTYWRILSIAGEVLEKPAGQREPHIILRSSERVFASTVGCNAVSGSYTLVGSGLSLGAGPQTMMACPPPLDAIERAWIQSIASVREAIVTGPTMELLTADGVTVAFLESVALP